MAKRYYNLEKETKEYLKACDDKGVAPFRDIKGINDIVISQKAFSRDISFLKKLNLSNCVLWLDASMINSYSGTGTNWADLSNSKNSGTLINGPTFNSINGGSLVFDGIDDYVNIPFNASTMDFSAAQTICMWLRPAIGSNSARRNPYNQAFGGPGTLTHETAGVISYFFGTNGGNNLPWHFITSTFTVTANETAFIAFTRNQATNTSACYKNGILSNVGTAGGYAATANGTSPILIGTGYTSAFLGNIYDVKVYNRALTQREIFENYNEQRFRFGL
jgi:hypothetical protein